MKSRSWAGFSLAVMASGFALSLALPDTAYTVLTRGAFEAGLVGGIADWFAVTALFRHPLGIPIPHTSLLLKNKQKIVNALVSAMEEELLNPHSIEKRIRAMRLFPAVGTYLTRLLRRKSARRHLVGFLIEAVRRFPLEKAVPPIQAALSGYLRQWHPVKTAETLVSRALQAGMDEIAFDFGIREALEWVRRKETGAMLGRLALEQVSKSRERGFVGFAVQAFAGFMNEDKLGLMLQNMLLAAGRDLLEKENPHRESILREVRVRLFQWAGDDGRMSRIRDWAADLAEGEDGAAFLHARLTELRGMLIARLEREREGGARLVFHAYASAVRMIRGEPERWAESVQNRLLSYISDLVKANHYRIGQLVKENVDRMDDAALVAMLERKIGKDLQWIRVNGAICGFLIGLALSAVSLVL